MTEARLRLTDTEIDDFWRDGVIIIRNLYSHQWIDHLREALDELGCLRRDLPSTERRFRSDAYTWHTNDRVRDFALHAPGAEFAAQALRSPRINLFCDQIFVKPAHNSERTPWHHDFTFFPISGNQIATLWTSVDPVKTEESALEFVAGSHLWPQKFRPLGVGGIVKSVAPLEATPDFDGDRGSYNIVSWDMKPGDAVLFHGLTLHGSRGKPAGDLNRRAIATRWCGEDVRYAPTGSELQIPWLHGLSPGDAIGGPIFPQVFPELKPDEIAARMAGPVAPDPERVTANAKLASRFERVEL